MSLWSSPYEFMSYDDKKSIYSMFIFSPHTNANHFNLLCFSNCPGHGCANENHGKGRTAARGLTPGAQSGFRPRQRAAENLNVCVCGTCHTVTQHQLQHKKKCDLLPHRSPLGSKVSLLSITKMKGKKRWNNSRLGLLAAWTIFFGVWEEFRGVAGPALALWESVTQPRWSTPLSLQPQPGTPPPVCGTMDGWVK